MPFQETKTGQLKKLVARNDIKQAIDELTIFAKESKSNRLESEMIMLNGQYFNLNTSIRKGILSAENESIETAKIRNSLLLLLQDFSDVIDANCKNVLRKRSEVEKEKNTHFVLFFGANPPRTARIEITQEAAIIQEELERCALREKIILEQRWDITPASMLQALLNSKPTILHFSGHGEPEEGRLILYKNTEESHEISHKAFVELLSMQETLRCVVLNCCFSDNLADEIIEYTHLECVIGMNDEIPDNAAITFSKGFYKSIGSGQSYEKAFYLGRNLIGLEGIEGVNVPVLRLKK